MRRFVAAFACLLCAALAGVSQTDPAGAGSAPAKLPALVAATERAFASDGVRGDVAITGDRLADAHRFYERLGYEPTSLRFARVLPPPG